MADYIEKIQVGSGTMWPLRDAEAHTQINENHEEVKRLIGDTETLIYSKHDEVTSQIETLTNTVNNIDNTSNANSDNIEDLYSQLDQWADYPIETGTNNSWIYTKWNSGRYEASLLLISSDSVSCTDLYGSVYSTGGIGFSLPDFNIEVTHYSGNGRLSSSSMSGIMSIEIPDDGNIIGVTYWSPIQITNSGYELSLKIEGRWK